MDGLNSKVQALAERLIAAVRMTAFDGVKAVVTSGVAD
jgi:hypothetical protein